MKLTEAQLKHFTGFLYPQVPLEKWAALYDLDLADELRCPWCLSLLKPGIPFAHKDYRGVIYEQCTCPECPKEQAPILFCNPKTRAEDREFARRLFSQIID